MLGTAKTTVIIIKSLLVNESALGFSLCNKIIVTLPLIVILQSFVPYL